MFAETSRGVAHLRLSYILSFKGLPFRQGHSIWEITEALCYKQSSHAVWYSGRCSTASRSSWRQVRLLDTRSYYLQDRRKVYAILEGEGIEIPRYAVLDRDSPDPKRKSLLCVSSVAKVFRELCLSSSKFHVMFSWKPFRYMPPFLSIRTSTE